MSKEKIQYYIVNKKILSDSIKKVIDVDEMIKTVKISTYEAIKRVGISRSTYYKYKDHIKPFYENVQADIYSIHLTISDRAGSLSDVLDVIAKAKINMLTVVQNMPVDGRASTTIMIQTNDTVLSSLNNVVETISHIDGVRDIRIIGNA